MADHFYRVIEDRILLNGNHSPVVQHYDHDETITDPETRVTRTLTAYDQAIARYHTIAAAAAVSALPYHSVVLEQETGIQIEKPLVWDRSSPPRRPSAEPPRAKHDSRRIYGAGAENPVRAALILPDGAGSGKISLPPSGHKSAICRQP